MSKGIATRLNPLPPKWNMEPLHRLVEFWDGKRIPLKQEVRDGMEGSVPYYGASGIIDYVNDFLFDDELILVGEDGENVVSRNLPLAFRISGRSWVNNHAHVLKPLAVVDITFLTEYLESLDYSAIASGSAQPKITQRQLQGVLVTFPPLPHQRKIAKILTTVDNLIEKTEALIAKYQSIKQGMMHDLFTRGVDAKGKLRPPQSEAPELYKQSELGWIPKEWEVMRLRDIVSHEKPVTYGIVQPGNFAPNGILLIRGQDYISGWNTEDNFFKVTKVLHHQFRRSTTQCNDVLICIVGATTGAVNRVPAWIKEANITQTTARISCDLKKSNSLFVEMFLASEGGKKQVRKYVKGSAQPGLNLADVAQFKLPIPPIFEQNIICGRLSVMRQKLDVESIYGTVLGSIKKALMEDLLTGKVQVTPDAEDKE